MRPFLPILVFMSMNFVCKGQHTRHDKELLTIVDDFFHALEMQDTTQLRSMFVKNGYAYAVREVTHDSVIVSSQPSSRWRFRPGQVIKERMRLSETTVQRHGRIAVVWAPYDLWVNDKFGHCGVDVFTFLNTANGWKITSIAYTVEPNGCH